MVKQMNEQNDVVNAQVADLYLKTLVYMHLLGEYTRGRRLNAAQACEAHLHFWIMN